MFENVLKGWTAKGLTNWIFCLTALDVASTYAGLKLGILEEANPLLSGAMASQPLLTSALVLLFVWWALGILGRVKDIRMFDFLGLVFFAKLGVIMLHVNGMVRSVI